MSNIDVDKIEAKIRGTRTPWEKEEPELAPRTQKPRN